MNMHAKIEADEDSQELVTVPPPETAMTVFSDKENIEPYLAMVRKHIDAFVPDMATAKGRKEIKSMAARVAKSKTALEEVGKALAAEAKELPKKIDATRKHMRDTLDAWRDEVRDPLTKFEAAEESRIAAHAAAIAAIGALATNLDGCSAENLRGALVEVNAFQVGPACEEFEDDFRSAIERSRNALVAAISAAEKREAEQAELAMLRKQAAEQAEKDRYAEIVRQEAEKVKAATERAAQLEIERIQAQAQAEREAAERATKAAADESARKEREAKEAADKAAQAVEDAKRRAEQAEADARAKLEQEQKAELAAAAKREADTKHRAKINNAAVAALVTGGLSEGAAKLAVTMIAKGMIPAIQIKY